MEEAHGALASFDEIQKYSEAYSGKLIVIKFGGALAEDDKVVGPIAKQVAFLRRSVGVSVIVVHGGGQQIDDALKEKGIAIARDKETGLRITDKPTLATSDIALRKLNQHITELFNNAGNGISATGYAGYDNDMIKAKSCGPKLGGFTGEAPEITGHHFLKDLLGDKKANAVPVIYPICHSQKTIDGENRINVNADDVAAALAAQMGAIRLILCSDIPGVLDKNGCLIPEISCKGTEQLITEGTVTGGMVAKLVSAARAAERLPDGGVTILNGRAPNSILEELLSDRGCGTLILG